MSDYQTINYSVTNRVATIALNAPKALNALHQKLRLELVDVTQRIEADDDVRIAVITGEGRGFCAGVDLTEGMPGFDNFVDQCAAEYTPWLMAIHNSNKLYIAAVNGAAAGIGSALAMNCDMMMMADDAYLYQAFSAIGLMPDGGATWLLLQKVGYQRAIEMAVDAGRLTAQECLELGVANKVVAADELRSEAQSWAERLALGAPLSQKASKNLMRKAFGMSYEQVIEQESISQDRLNRTDDFRQGVEAFFAKQKPVFKGK